MPKISSLILLVGLTLASGTGCNRPQISAADYDQGCSVDADCVSVREGDVCVDVSCGCETAGVAGSDADSFAADFDALRSQCSIIDSSGPCIECQTSGSCVSGKCTARIVTQ